MQLAERLGYKSLNELLTSLTNNEIMEWMAFDSLKDENLRKKYQQQLEATKELSPEEEAEMIKRMFGIK